jgi:hypothetical protein
MAASVAAVAIRIGKHVSGISDSPMSGATTSAAPRSRPLFASAAAFGLDGWAFDPDHGKDQDGSGGSADHA